MAKQRGVTRRHRHGTLRGTAAARRRDGGRRASRSSSSARSSPRGRARVQLPGFPDDPRVLDSTVGARARRRAAAPAGGRRRHHRARAGDGLRGARLRGDDRRGARSLDARPRSRSRAPAAAAARAAPRRDPPAHEGDERRSARRRTARRLRGREGARRRISSTACSSPSAAGRTATASAPRPRAFASTSAASSRVDERMATNLPHVFAIGDVARAPLLAHKASHEGKTAAEAACDLRSPSTRARSRRSRTPIPRWRGSASPRAMRARRSSKWRSRASRGPRAAARSAWAAARESTKLLFAKDTRRLVGAGIVGPHAGDLISECALAIELGADVHDIALTVHPHPTLGETIGLAAEVAAGTITDLYCRAAPGDRMRPDLGGGSMSLFRRKPDRSAPGRGRLRAVFAACSVP